MIIGPLRMLHPVYEVQVGSDSFTPSTSDRLKNITVSLTMDSPANSFRGWFRTQKKKSNPSPGNNGGRSEVLVSLGYEGADLAAVFKGSTDSYGINFEDHSVSAFSSIADLTSLRLNRHYKDKTAGDIVEDLTTTASIEVEKISPGIAFPYYAIDHNKNAFEHVAELALICGFNVYNTPNDKLVFSEYSPTEPEHQFEYGKNIIAISKEENPNPIGTVRVTGESLGSTKSHWISKAKVEGISGESLTEGQFELLINCRALKKKTDLPMVAEAILNKLKLSDILVLDVIGDPSIKLGDGIQVKSSPDERLNGSYRIGSIVHHVGITSGYVTTLTCRGVKKEE